MTDRPPTPYLQQKGQVTVSIACIWFTWPGRARQPQRANTAAGMVMATYTLPSVAMSEIDSVVGNNVAFILAVAEDSIKPPDSCC